jgi:hypothetical protein
VRHVRYNEVALLNGRIEHSQNSLNVEKYSVTEQKKNLGWGGETYSIYDSFNCKRNLLRYNSRQHEFRPILRIIYVKKHTLQADS